MRPDRCPHCNYDTRGNRGSKCPECGEDTRTLPHASIRKFAIGLLGASGLAAFLCITVRSPSGATYLLLALAWMLISLNSLLLPVLLLLNGVRRRQDGRDTLRERGIDGSLALLAWFLWGLAFVGLRNSGFFAI